MELQDIIAFTLVLGAVGYLLLRAYRSFRAKRCGENCACHGVDFKKTEQQIKDEEAERRRLEV